MHRKEPLPRSAEKKQEIPADRDQSFILPAENKLRAIRENTLENPNEWRSIDVLLVGTNQTSSEG